MFIAADKVQELLREHDSRRPKCRFTEATTIIGNHVNVECTIVRNTDDETRIGVVEMHDSELEMIIR